MKKKILKLRHVSSNIFVAAKESLKGKDIDYTNISIKRALLLLSIPMVLEMVMESIFSVVDIFFVSKLGADAIATVGLTESVITLVYTLGIGLSMGTAAMVSRRIGEKRHDDASCIAFQAIILTVLLSFLIAIPGVLFPKEILGLMGASDNAVNQYSDYTAIMLGGNVIIMLLFVINSVFRSAGDAIIAMGILCFANIINIILDPCLIFGIGPFPELGIKGAAIATNIGRGIAVLFQLKILLTGDNRVVIKRKHMKIVLSQIVNLLKLSTGGIGQLLIMTSSWIVLARMVASFGSEIMSGYTIAIRVIIFAILPCHGLANATATLVGQNLGVKQPDRSEKSVWITSQINSIVLAVVSIILVLFAEFFIGFFTNQPAIIASGAECLRIISYGVIVFGVGSVFVSSLNGAGDTKSPTVINIFCFWLFEIPLAYVLANYTPLLQNGIYYSIIIAEALMAIWAFYVFRSGKWKTKVV